MSIGDQFVVRNLDTGEVYRPSSFGIGGASPVPTTLSATDVMEFKSVFNTFPEDERLLHVVRCQLWESLASFQARNTKKRHSGVMYVSNRHLSFFEEGPSIKKPVKIGIPLNEIIDLEADSYDQSVGIVVSTLRDTKFFFDKFQNDTRDAAFTAVQRSWELCRNPSDDHSSSIFDPLGGLSAVTSTAVKAAIAHPAEARTVADIFAAQSENASAKPPPPSSSALPSKPASSTVKPALPPPAHMTSPLPAASPTSASLSHHSTQRTRPRSTRPPEPHFMDMVSGDSWFMTLTKIYYFLGVQEQSRPSPGRRK